MIQSSAVGIQREQRRMKVLCGGVLCGIIQYEQQSECFLAQPLVCYNVVSCRQMNLSVRANS